MKKNNFIYIFLAAYLATFLRLTIDNNFIISIIGSFFVGFFVSKRLSYTNEKILRVCGIKPTQYSPAKKIDLMLYCYDLTYSLFDIKE